MILNVAIELKTKGYTIDLVLVNADGFFINQVPPEIQIVDLGAKRAIGSITNLIRYFKTQRPRIVFPSLPHISVITLLARLFSRLSFLVVPIEHNTLSQSVRHANTLTGRSLPYFMRITYPFADRIIAVSNGVAEDLAHVLGLPRQQLSVIYNPVITPEVIAQSNIDVDHPWLKKGQPPVILGVGRFTQAKGFAVLIRALSLVRKTAPARLILLGEGPDEQNLKGLISKLDLSNDVLMPGFVDNPYAYFRNSSIFVLSSLWEGLPTVLIEALACGARVISSDCPSGPREILTNPEWGALVPVGDEYALAKQILNTLGNPFIPVDETSWNRFTVAQSISDYETLIKDLSN